MALAHLALKGDTEAKCSFFQINCSTISTLHQMLPGPSQLKQELDCYAETHQIAPDDVTRVEIGHITDVDHQDEQQIMLMIEKGTQLHCGN